MLEENTEDQTDAQSDKRGGTRRLCELYLGDLCKVTSSLVDSSQIILITGFRNTGYLAFRNTGEKRFWCQRRKSFVNSIF